MTVGRANGSMGAIGPVRVLHVGCVLDRQRRPPEALLAAWPTLADVAAAARGAGAQVTVLQAAHQDATLEQDGCELHFVSEPRVARLPGSRGGAGVVPLRLARRAAALRPDLVHVNGLEFPLHVRALARALPRVPILLQDHAGQPPARRRRLHRWRLAPAAGVAFTAAAQARAFFQAGVLRADVPVYEVPESSTHFTPGGVAAARAAAGVSGDPALLWIGRLDPNKDPLTILEAVSRAGERLPQLRLWMCFDDAPLIGDVQARLEADPHLSRRVHLVGRVPHAGVEQLCRAADFLVLGSHRESTGYAVLEAMACGATPILCDIPAFRALTGDGRVGALVPPGDATGFAAAIVRLAAADRGALRRQAREHFVKELSFPALGNRLVRIYEELLQSSRRPRGALPRPAPLPVHGSAP